MRAFDSIKLANLEIPNTEKDKNGYIIHETVSAYKD